MLAVRPDAVAVDNSGPDGFAVVDTLAEFHRISLFGSVPLPWHVDDLSASGTIGDPTGANAEWGESALDAQSTALAETLVELSRFRYPPTGPSA